MTTSPTPRDGLARRLLRLPHVVPRPRRAAARHRRAGRPRLQPARRHEGLPGHVDFCLVEGAVPARTTCTRSSMVRERTKTLISFGDCAVTANVPGMRNPIGGGRCWSGLPRERRPQSGGSRLDVVPALLPMARPVHRVVKVDVFLPGCPPSADLIYRCSSTCSRGGRPTRSARGSADEDDRHDQPDRHRPDHPHRGSRARSRSISTRPAR